MTPDISRDDILDIQRSLYSTSFVDFVKAFWYVIDNSPYRHNWHIDAICEHLEAVADGKIKRLLINVPPGTAKSKLTCVLFPAWLWTRSPGKAIVSTGHSFEFSTRDTRICRELIKSPEYQNLWPIGMSEDQDQKTGFENLSRGSRYAKAFTSLTGFRCNLLIVDDPHAVDEAKSDPQRNATVETFLESVPSRLNDPMNDAIVVIMQRLHENDVSGAILERPDLGYEHLCIPMEYDAEPHTTWQAAKVVDPRQEIGELLFPARFNTKVVEQYKASLGPYAYAGQYQQTPVPKTDGFLQRDWFHRFGPAQCPRCSTPERIVRHKLPEALNYYMTSDHAPAGSKTGDFNVFRIWGVDSERNIWMVDSFRKRCDLDEALGIERVSGKIKLRPVGALPLIKRYSPLGWFPEKDISWHAMNGATIAAMRDLNIMCRIEPLTSHGKGNKMVRASAYASLAQMGSVYLPDSAVGDTALLEYIKFPGKVDDQVDADAIIGRVLQEAHPAFVSPEQHEQDDEDYDWHESRRRMESDSESFF